MLAEFASIEQCREWIEKTQAAAEEGRILIHTEMGPLYWLTPYGYRNPWHRITRHGLKAQVEYYDGATFHYADIVRITRTEKGD